MTIYAVPCTHGDGIHVVLGTGNETIVPTTAYYAAVALGAPKGTVIAIWNFRAELSLDDATDLAETVPPTALLICSSDDFGVLKLDPGYLPEVKVSVADGYKALRHAREG